MQEPPKISLICGVYNAADTIGQLIQSVADQTYQDLELVVVDGDSGDGTTEVLERRDSEITRWVSEPDGGIYEAWNKGLKLAQGDWIAFIGADDYLWSPDAVERLATHLSPCDPVHRLVYGQLMCLEPDGRRYLGAQPWEKIAPRFPHISGIPQVGLMHHRSLFDDYGVFDESFRISGDYEFLLRVLKHEDPLHIPDVIVAGMRRDGMSNAFAAKDRLDNMLEGIRARRMHHTGLPPRMKYLEVRRFLRESLRLTFGEGRVDPVLSWWRSVRGRGWD